MYRKMLEFLSSDNLHTVLDELRKGITGGNGARTVLLRISDWDNFCCHVMKCKVCDTKVLHMVLQK